LTPVRKVHENPWFHINSRGGYYVLEYPTPQTVILPVVEQNHILMVRVKRPVINDCPLELPAGGALENEPLVQAAQRELFEETGIYVRELQRFLQIAPISEMPGRFPTLLGIFKVHLTQADYQNRTGHCDEIVRVELISFNQVKYKIARGEIYLSSPMAILARYFLQLEVPDHD
jgi:8-oxo-dGTP pyrophosphatase MutT (NUDIX family)